MGTEPFFDCNKIDAILVTIEESLYVVSVIELVDKPSMCSYCGLTWSILQHYQFLADGFAQKGHSFLQFLQELFINSVVVIIEFNKVVPGLVRRSHDLDIKLAFR